MLIVGVTGGIGAGKSTVARALAERGAAVIDADGIAREVVAPGEVALARIAERFGSGVIAADGSLDRAALATIVFADDRDRRDLEDITHPAIHRRIEERLRALRATPAPPPVAVLDHPLLIETGWHRAVDLVVVVEADEDVRLRRLVERGLDEADARARIGAQASDEQRRAHADVVIRNDAGREVLARRVDRLWERLSTGDAGGGRRDTAAEGGPVAAGRHDRPPAPG